MAQKITVDTTPGFRMPTIFFSQGDIGRVFQIDLASRFGDTLPASPTVTIKATKPSGFGFSVAADSLTGSVATFTTTAEMTDEAGRFPAEIEISKSGNVLYTANFNIACEQNTHPEGTTDGSAATIIPELTLLVQRAEDAASSVLDRQTVTTTLPAGSQATYTFDEATNTQTFGIPEGEAGAGAAGVVASAYSSSKTYAVGDYVLHNSNLYRCTTAITTAESFTAAHWTQIVLADDVSDLKAEINKIDDTHNMFLDAPLVAGKYYVDSENPYPSGSYFTVNVEAGTTYIVLCKMRFIAGNGELIVNNTSDSQFYVYTAPRTEKNYVTVYNDDRANWAMCKFDDYVDDIGSYDVPALTYVKDVISTIRNEGNIFNRGFYVQGKYYYESESSHSDYSYFAVPVKSGETYQFACRVRFLSKFSAGISSTEMPIGGTYTSDFDGMLYVTVYKVTQAGEKWAMSKLPQSAFAVGEYQKYTLKQDIIADITAISKGWTADAKNLGNGSSITLPITNNKKNDVYSFFAKVQTFGEISIGHGKNDNYSSYITITGTTVTVNTKYSDGVQTETYTHGLSFADFINVLIKVSDTGLKADIKIMTSSGDYSITDAAWEGCGKGNYNVICSGGVFTDCKFTWSCKDIRLPLWGFGDSYFSIWPTRWPQYLYNDGWLDNVLLNAYPGEDSTEARKALRNLFIIGKPKIAIWSLGMNDGADNGDTPASTWLTGVTEFLSFCNGNNVTPILCTVPTVPSISHEAKNAYVRNSGYRYIDFAKAVGAQSDGTWYSGMLSADAVHPTEKGAKALFYRAVLDCPELTFEQ